MTSIGMKRCCYCGEDVRQEMRRCPYCGSILDNAKKENPAAVSETECIQVEQVNQDAEPKPDMEEVEVRGSFEKANDQRETTDTGANEVWERPAGARPSYAVPVRKSKGLGNGTKVFLTVVASVVPGIGQLVGLIVALVYMNAEEDGDRNSFGRALLAASLIMFVLTCVTWLIMATVFYNNN